MSLFHQIALTLIPGIGDVTAKQLLLHYKNAENIFTDNAIGLKSILGNKPKIIQAILTGSMFAEAEKELAFIEKHNIQTFFYTDDAYPQRLKRSECNDCPILLYFKGNADLNNPKIISIVGTRNATSYGEKFVTDLLQSLSNENILIVSGLAYGVDTFAHKYALQNKLSTIGVVAHGLHMIYPAQNKKMAAEMVANGGVLTEFRSTINPVPGIFPKRNRVIAALSDATIVVEASKKGGALITAEVANGYNREVFAVPGNINSPQSEGCNFLIKTNRANLIQNAEDLYYVMGWNQAKTKKPVQQKMFIDLNDDETLIYNLITQHKTCSFDELCMYTTFPQSQLSCLLLELELKGIIKSLPGKRYCIE